MACTIQYKVVKDPDSNYLSKIIQVHYGDEKERVFRRDFLRFFSTLLHLPPPRFHVSEDAGIEPTELLRLWNWLSDALTTRLDLI